MTQLRDLLHQTLLVCILFYGGIAKAQETSSLDEPQQNSIDSIAGQWITNKGVLELTVEGKDLTGTFNQKTKVSGNWSSG